MTRPVRRSALLPYTTLFRSGIRAVETSRQRPEGLAGERVGLLLGVAVGRDDEVAQVGEAVGVLAVELARLDVDALQLTDRSEEHMSELQSHVNLVCRLLLEK